MMSSLYSPFAACISAILSTPVFGAGLGGVGGGKSIAVGAREVFRLIALLGTGGSARWVASLASENVSRAVRMTISRPLRSSTSNLSRSGLRSMIALGFQADDIPIEIVVQNLDSRRLQTPGRFLCNRDDNRRVRFSDDEAFLALPLEFVASSTRL